MTISERDRKHVHGVGDPCGLCMPKCVWCGKHARAYDGLCVYCLVDWEREQGNLSEAQYERMMQETERIYGPRDASV